MNKQTEAKRVLIFALVSTDGKQVFIGKTPQSPLKVYRYHQAGRSPYTKGLFAPDLPRMYILESLHTTEEIAHRHCIAWYTWLEQLGFVCIGSPSVRDGSADMLPETHAIFEQIAELSLEDVLTEKNLVPAPSSPKKSKMPTKIAFSVSPDTYQKIALAAKERNLLVSTYCRQAATDGCVVMLNFSELRSYADAVRSLQAQTQALSLALYRYGVCEPDALAQLCTDLRAYDARQ